MTACFGGRDELLQVSGPTAVCVDAAGLAFYCTPVGKLTPAAGGEGGEGGDGSGSEATLPPPRRASRVLAISMDGLGATYLAEHLEAGILPTFQRLADLGAHTLNARPDYEVTVTLPNHASMLSGRPVTAVPGLPEDVFHGYLGNALPAAGETLHNAGNPAVPYVASMYDVAHDRGYSTCLYSGKPKFLVYDQSYDAAHGAPDETGKDDGRDKLDHFVLVEDRSLLTIATGELAAGRCDLTLLHVTDLDTPVGHSTAWGSDTWIQTLIELDGLLGELLAQLEANGGLESWGIILTADHGGEATNHLDATLPRVYHIPFYVVGPGVPPGSDLYELLDGRRTDPGEERPGYDAPGQPVRNGDLGNLALELLGLPEIPGSLMKGLRLGG